MEPVTSPSTTPSRTAWRRAVWRMLAHCLPDTLFGRLALVLFVAVVASHLLALTLMFELAPHHGAGAPDGHPHGPPPGWPLGLLLDVGIRLLALLGAAWVGATWLSQPLQRLASAARELGRDIHRAPLAEDGTTECREAARVVNQMQAQIRHQLRERDQFVAAVSHDLRTPLTRLRLRAETLADAEQKQRFGQDIVEMDAMISATLDYLRGAADPEPFVLLDLNALVHSIADDQQACGAQVEVMGHAQPLPAQASALRRCIDNLVANAIRFGGSASICLTDSGHSVRIVVSDAGPGIAPDELDKVLAPFYRLEGSRNRHTGGVGLGLSIAHDIVQRHHGRLWLANGEPTGLVVTLELPRHPV